MQTIFNELFLDLTNTFHKGSPFGCHTGPRFPVTSRGFLYLTNWTVFSHSHCFYARGRSFVISRRPARLSLLSSTYGPPRGRWKTTPGTWRVSRNFHSYPIFVPPVLAKKSRFPLRDKPSFKTRPLRCLKKCDFLVVCVKFAQARKI